MQAREVAIPPGLFCLQKTAAAGTPRGFADFIHRGRHAARL